MRIKFLVFMLVATVVLSGCSLHPKGSVSERYIMLNDHLGQRVNVFNHEACFLVIDYVNCFQTIPNPYLEGDWALPEIGVQFQIVRNEKTGLMEIFFDDGTEATLVFANQHMFFMVGGEEVITMGITVQGNVGEVYLGDDIRYRMIRIVSYKST